ASHRLSAADRGICRRLSLAPQKSAAACGGRGPERAAARASPDLAGSGVRDRGGDFRAARAIAARSGPFCPAAAECRHAPADSAIFLLDTGLLFEAFFRILGRLVVPVFAFFSVYSLLVIVFAALYSLVDLIQPGAQFSISGQERTITFAE